MIFITIINGYVEELSIANACKLATTTMRMIEKNLMTCVLIGECIWLQGHCNRNTFDYLEHQQVANRSKCATPNKPHKVTTYKLEVITSIKIQ
jgi:hypothetical protein